MDAKRIELLKKLLECWQTAYNLKNPTKKLDEAWSETLFRLCEDWLELNDKVERLRAFKRSVDEALNSGDGSYRP